MPLKAWPELTSSPMPRVWLKVVKTVGPRELACDISRLKKAA
ncbi:MAG TPA: hypothetical protein VLQ45_13885 [Thermoanaerobaculia bacterium]|nr:hypothetical protein [Thermoanaerobaculia bacterium]